MASPAGSAQATGFDDGSGREWRQIDETTGLSWNQVATVCPTDGVTPCAGSVGGTNLSGWVWATQAQVLGLMGQYAPELLEPEATAVNGGEYLLPAAAFLGSLGWTGYLSVSYTHYSEWGYGWTASTDDTGRPIAGGAYFQHPIFAASLGVGPVADADDADQDRGVFLWRTAGLDYAPPVITPVIDGTQGTNGWYVSDVAVSWQVVDHESAIGSTTGCAPSSVVADTSGDTFTCEATSAGGTATRSTTVQRDIAAPTLTCATPAPVLQQGRGGQVTARVTDARSGPSTPIAAGWVSTATLGTFAGSVTGLDRAGNSASTTCPYSVVPRPGSLCEGLEPTVRGTNGDDIIRGTSGVDVIVGRDGRDTIRGMGGDDVICGGMDRDTLSGGTGTDSCRSGERRTRSCEVEIA